MTLDDKIRDLLGRLSTLSEAPAGNLEAQISRSAPESSAPSGAEEFPRSNDDVRDRSLFDWYRTSFERNADNPERLLSLYLAGEREYLRRSDPRVHDRTVERGSIVALSESGSVVEEVAAIQVIKEFEGVHALDVAIVEGKTEAWVRKVRRQHGRDPEDGRPRPEFLDYDEDRRREAVAEQVAKGRGKKAAAKALGVNPDTVRRYWPEEAVAA
jgi:hypothetical protein